MTKPISYVENNPNDAEKPTHCTLRFYLHINPQLTYYFIHHLQDTFKDTLHSHLLQNVIHSNMAFLVVLKQYFSTGCTETE